jgi:hypothetical protein
VDELPEEVQVAFGPVLADLDCSSPGCVRITPGGDGNDEPDARLWDRENGSGASLWISRVEG